MPGASSYACLRTCSSHSASHSSDYCAVCIILDEAVRESVDRAICITIDEAAHQSINRAVCITIDEAVCVTIESTFLLAYSTNVGSNKVPC